MGLTTERINIKINLDCDYKYKGKDLDYNESDTLTRDLKEDILDRIFQTLDCYMQKREELEELKENINIKINNKNYD